MSGLDVLLIEDSATDVMMTREALADAELPVELHVVPDGVEALEFLRRRGRYAAVPRPALVLLDLNLPKKDGREVLAELKQDPDLSSIPVVILTTSRSEEDIDNAYRLHANCYVVKPLDYTGFQRAVSAIESFWLTVAQLPKLRRVSEAEAEAGADAKKDPPS